MIRAIQGGKASGGFLSGFAGSLLGGFAKGLQKVDIITKTIIVAIAGGTASVLGGGKFANGAMSAAFIFMFNHMAGKLLEKARNLAVGKGTKEASQAIGINKSMVNIIKGGVVGATSGALSATPGGPYGAIAGGIIGGAAGLVAGAGYEAFGVNRFIDNTINATIDVGQQIYQGGINTYNYLKYGYGGNSNMNRGGGTSW